MKLRLQLASTLPTIAKLGPTDPPGKAAFGTTMQAMMATLPSVRGSAVGFPGDFTDMQSRIPKNPRTGEAAEVTKGSAAEGAPAFVSPKDAQVGTPFPVVPLNESMGPGEPSEEQGKQCTNG